MISRKFLNVCLKRYDRDGFPLFSYDRDDGIAEHLSVTTMYHHDVSVARGGNRCSSQAKNRVVTGQGEACKVDTLGSDY